MEKGNRPKLNKRVQNVVDVLEEQAFDNTDPNGMYTGRPRNVNEVPVQDDDDL